MANIKQELINALDKEERLCVQLLFENMALTARADISLITARIG